MKKAVGFSLLCYTVLLLILGGCGTEPLLIEPTISPERVSPSEGVAVPTPTPPVIPLPTPAPTPAPAPTPTPEPGPEVVQISINAVGDITWGGDSGTNGFIEFHHLYRQHGIDFFLYNTREIFAEADLNIANLEGTFTNRRERREDATWAFSAPPHMAHGLVTGGIDAVTIANNHIFDFNRQGYYDTRAALRDAGMPYFGMEHNLIMEVNGVYVGLFGFLVYVSEWRVQAAINDLRERGAQIVIAYFHWGIMGETRPLESQRRLGRFTLDSGADLVLGSHPHNIQGVEVHNGRFIVYSLADFSYAGHSSPADMDSFIFQKTFTLIDGELQLTQDAHLLPLMQSSRRPPYIRQNFQPTPALGEDYTRIRERLQLYSSWLNNDEGMAVISQINQSR